MSKEFWDKAVSYFNTCIDTEDLHEGIADNVLIAWPVMLDFINKFSKSKSIRILDFGCGPGDLCNILCSKNYDVTGIDFSSEMIKVARKKYGNKIDFYTGEAKEVSEIANKRGKFDIIVSSMVFQFINNIEETIDELAKSLKKRGLICFAVHDQNWVRESLKNNILHHQPEGTMGVEELMIELIPGEKIKNFNWSSGAYTEIFRKAGFKKIMEEYPDFTREWIEKYCVNEPVNVPKFMILGFQKN